MDEKESSTKSQVSPPRTESQRAGETEKIQDTNERQNNTMEEWLEAPDLTLYTRNSIRIFN